GRLLDPDSVRRGSVLVYVDPIFPEHRDLLLDGSGCIVQTYTSNLDGALGHLIAATGVVKAVGLRLKVWGIILSGIGLVGNGH
ncbi:MAG: HlyD family secretion protein, partial [Pseudomonadota bacterium]